VAATLGAVALSQRAQAFETRLKEGAASDELATGFDDLAVCLARTLGAVE